MFIDLEYTLALFLGLHSRTMAVIKREATRKEPVSSAFERRFLSGGLYVSTSIINHVFKCRDQSNSVGGY